MNKTLILAVLLLTPMLAEAKTTDITGRHYASGCGWNMCWPEFTLTRKTLLTTASDPAASHPSREAYAYALVSSGPWCRTVLPKVAPAGVDMDKLEAHEAWHCMGGKHND